MSVVLTELQKTWAIFTHRLGLTRRRPFKELFRKIQIETNTFCTRECSFCPTSKFKIKDKMSDTVFNKVVAELKELDFAGEVGLYMRNEPMLDKELAKKISAIKRSCPKSVVYIASNGDLMTTEKLKELFDSGLDYMAVHPYDGAKQVLAFRNMILDFTNKGSVKFVDKKSDIPDIRKGQHIWITDKSSWSQMDLDSPEARELPISNRGGVLDDIHSVKKSLPLICARPFRQITITATGKVSLCCGDWMCEAVVGDVNNEKLTDIWFGTELERFRKNLFKYKRDLSPCSSCTNERKRLPVWMRPFYL